MSKLIGLLYHPRLEGAHMLALQLKDSLEDRGHRTWFASAWEERDAKNMVPGTDVVVSVGGDGTIMRAVRIVLPETVPILGIRYGRLGFLADIDPANAVARVPVILDRPPRTEVRTMLQASCLSTSIDPALSAHHYPLMAANGDYTFHALNEVAIARGATGRPISVSVSIDGQLFTTYRADAVVLSTATGSTAYSFSAGGPVLHPTSEDFVITPVSPQGIFNNALVLSSVSTVQLTATSDHGSMLSVDGQLDIPLESGETVTVRRSPHRAYFLRATAQDGFYAELLTRLRFGDTLDP